MVITEGDLGGAQRHVLDVSRELIKRGHDVRIAVGGDFMDLTRASGIGAAVVQVVRIKNLVRPVRPLQDIVALFELYKRIRTWHPDVVHCHSSKAGGLASVAGWMCHVPVVYTAHGFVFRENIGFLKRKF